MRITLYGNGSSGNHGCEAIVRGTVKLLGQEANTFRLQSENPSEDRIYGLSSLVKICPAKCGYKKGVHFLAAYAKLKFTRNYTDMDGLHYLSGIHEASTESDLALSVGGDNYCYGGTGIYAYLNRAYQKQGLKTSLWGCSIEPDVVRQKQVAQDLARYNLIVARESITYESVKTIQHNTVFSPDPAFFMEPQKCSVDSRLISGHIIGINISPMIISNEQKAGIAYENYKVLIRHILSETDAAVALIPHVVWRSNDDRVVLRQLYQDLGEDPRLLLVEDHTAPELKYIISQCDFFIGARTHATIAAYSSCVPTLVVGYSVKARGIARDLFGTEQGYVVPVQDLSTPSQLWDAFLALYHNRQLLQTRLAEKMPGYLAKAENAVTAVKELVNG